jgi:BASS family bile acid:Na+ symporter
MNPDMSMDTIIKLVIVTGIVLIVFAIGIRARIENPLLLVRKPALALRAMVAMFVLLPLFALMVTRLLPLQQGVGAALLGVAVSPMLPPWAKMGSKVGAKGDYVFGLQVLATAFSIFVVPVMLWLVDLIFNIRGTFNPFAFSMILFVTVGLPLALGLATGRYRPDSAPRLADLAERGGNVLLVLGVIGLLVTSGSVIPAVIGQGTLLAILAITGFGLLVGHLLGGPDPGNRGALATATASRHPGIALLLATEVFPDRERAILGTVLLYLVVDIAITVPYQRWRKKVLVGGP